MRHCGSQILVSGHGPTRLSLPVLPDVRAGVCTEPHVRVCTPGLQQGTRRPDGCRQAERRRLTYPQTSAMLTSWKRTEELAFLNEVAAVPLQQSLRHLQGAFVAFWEGRARHPRFKTKRRHYDAAEYTRSGFRFQHGQLTLVKLRGPLNIRWSRPLPEGSQPSTVTVSRDPAGRWYVSLRVVDATVRPLPPVQTHVGIDAGLSSLMTLSTGERITNPRYESQDRARLARAQRVLSRRQKGSSNRAKARLRVARIYARIS
jgi:putative transposase